MRNDSERQVVFSGRIVEVVRAKRALPDGRTIEIEFAERSPGVRGIVTDGENILLTREWREEAGGWDYRLPGGKVFDTLEEFRAGRDDDAVLIEACRRAASRELQEEANLAIVDEDFKPIHVSVAGATIVWDLHYFVARIDRAVASSKAELTHEGELIERHWISTARVLDLLIEGAIGEERSAAVLFRLLLSELGQRFGLPPISLEVGIRR
jgi:ADP-ribose pyrophosphatase